MKKLENLKKKIIYRSSYRGTKEMDLLLSAFVKYYIESLSINDLLELEKFLNFEDPMAKYAGALGGFLGFVGGAPMKIGAKGVQLIAKPFIKATGRESLETVMRYIKLPL